MKYEVTIRATVIKTIPVEAVDADDALEQANELFSVRSDDYAEDYREEVLDIVEK